MRLAEYKKWLIYHMKMKIKASQMLEPFNLVIDAERNGFVNALKVMITFVKEVDQNNPHLAIHKETKKK